MAELTVSIPNIGTEGIFKFKEPYDMYLKNKFHTIASFTKMKVVSIISIGDRIRVDAKDPFTDLYEPAGLPETEYKLDVINNIPIISLMYSNNNGVVKYFRVPATYIESISDTTDVQYINRYILIDLNKLATTTDLSGIYEDLRDVIHEKLGVVASINDLSLGEVETITNGEHILRENIRTNAITEKLSYRVRALQAELKYSEVIQRLNDLGIILQEV